MRRFVLIPHIKIHNANAMSSPYTIGFPAMTAWLGAVHALQRKLRETELSELTFPSVAVSCHLPAVELSAPRQTPDSNIAHRTIIQIPLI